MNSTIKKISLSILVIALLTLSACSTRYVCYDGTVERNIEACPKVEQPVITQIRAERAADTYANAYAQALNSRSHRVNTYREGAHWYSEILFTNIIDGTVNHVTLKIHGQSSSVSCFEGCEYFERKEIDEKEIEEALNETSQMDDAYYNY